MRRAFLRVAAVAAVTLVSQASRAADFPYDVPYVPTPPVVVDEMLRIAHVTANDYVMDLGCGDGRIVIEAAREFGARGFGLDLDENLLAQARANAEAAGVADRVSFARQDLFTTDLSPATVVTMYLLPSVNRRLKDTLLGLKPGTRIVSHDFDLDDWKPDLRRTVRKNVFLWIVPAQVAGVWRITSEVGGKSRTWEAEIRQKYQEIDGFVRNSRIAAGLWQARLEGDRIAFTIVDNGGAAPGEPPPFELGLYFEGRVEGDRMEGSVWRGVGRGETEARWRAERVNS